MYDDARAAPATVQVRPNPDEQCFSDMNSWTCSAYTLDNITGADVAAGVCPSGTLDNEPAAGHRQPAARDTLRRTGGCGAAWGCLWLSRSLTASRFSRITQTHLDCVAVGGRGAGGQACDVSQRVLELVEPLL